MPVVAGLPVLNPTKNSFVELLVLPADQVLLISNRVQLKTEYSKTVRGKFLDF